MEQESDAVAGVVEDGATEAPSEVVAEEINASPSETTAATENDDGRNATEQGGEDRSEQAEGSPGEEAAAARSAKRKKSYRPSLEVVEVKVDLFYDKAVFKRGLQHGELARDNVAPHHSFGLDTALPDNLKYIEPGKVMYAAGNTLVILEVSTMKRRVIFGLDGGGIGAFAVHPTRTLVAVGEKGASPNIYVYEYPSFKIAKVLRKGTERGYRAMDFTITGEKLASVGQAPDFMLTVWDWKYEKVILHCKAFGQDVAKVKFSPDDEGRLTTSGTGHIRFWRVANTFTGLKLQGDIGKFGKVEMSDIDCFCHMPDGKVVSGAESGSLLVWEGQFIKCRIVRPGETGCHDGPVLHVSLDRTDMLVVTAGADGYIRWWPFVSIDGADSEDDSMCCEVTPLWELFVGETVAARCVERGGVRGNPTSDHLLITDGMGALWQVPMPARTTAAVAVPTDSPAPETRKLATFHAGAITGVDTSFLEQLAATSGVDGTVRVWDFLTKKPLEMARFSRPAHCLEWANDHVDPAGHTIVAGFADGVVRVLVRDPNRADGEGVTPHEGGGGEKGEGVLRRAQTLKPHDGAVVALAYSPNGKLLVTAGKDRKLFFIKSWLTAEMQDYHPVGFCTVPSVPTSVCWHGDSSSVMVTCIGGEVAEIDLSGGHLDSVDSSQSFEIPDIPMRWYTFKRRPVQSVGTTPALELPEDAGGEPSAANEDLQAGEADGAEANDGGEEEDVPEEAVPPPPALKAVYAPGEGRRFLLALGTWARGAIFECSWQEEFPIREFPAGYGPTSTAAVGARPPTVTTLRYSGPAAVDVSSGKPRAGGGVDLGEGKAELLVCGCDDGGVTVRPALAAGVYARVQAHGGDTTVAAAASSCDGEWIVSGDSDGLLAVHRLRREPFEAAAIDLSERLRHVPIPPALSPASTPLGSRGKKRGKSPARDPPPAPLANEPLEPPAFLSEYMDDGQGAVAELEGFTPVQPVAQGYGSEAPLIEEEAPDIVDDAAYSIQEDKLKTEDDNRRMAAEAKKEGVRAVIRQMQAEFRLLVDENASAPPGERLTDVDLLVDPGYEEMLERQGKELCEEVKRELEYSKEESELHLAKLRSRFTDNVEMECITLRALQWDYETSSFRVEKTSPGLQELLDGVHKQIRSEERENMIAQADFDGESMSEAGLSSSGLVGAQGALSTAEASGVAGGGGSTAGGGAGTEGSGGGEEKVSTFEARKAKRHARQMALSKLRQAKPAEDADDPRDVATIALANASMGDYKLKSSEDYEVPEEMQLNVSKKQREMVLLEESLHAMRSRFNSRFMALRSIKREILATVAADNRRLRQIDTELGGSGDGGGDLWEPVLDPAEWPEMRDYVSPAELHAYAEVCKSVKDADAARGAVGVGGASLPPPPPRVRLDLVDLVAAEAARAEQQQRRDGEDRKNADQTATPDEGELDSDGAADQAPKSELGVSSSKAASPDAVLSMLKDVDGMINRLPAARGSDGPTDGDLSALEEEERAAKEMLLRHERRTILEAAAENVLAFDEAVYDLRRERILTAAHLKAAELKLLVLKQELELLNQFDTKDRALSTKQDKQQHDKNEVVTAIAGCKAKLSTTQAEAEVGAGLEAEVVSSFLALIPQSSQFHETLNKIFRKKIKRAKKRLNGEEEDGDNDSDEEESDEDDYDFDDDDEEEVDDICPPGCDIALYEKVLELRESRLDHEETLAEVQKATDEHKRNLDRQVTRQRQIDKDLNQTATEIKAAQADKQAELNKLDVVVSLKLNQLYCMDNAFDTGRPPEGAEEAEKPRRRGSVSRPKFVADAGMDTHILFTRVGLDRLKRRILELVQENKAERNNFKELHRDRSRLEKARVIKEAEMEEHQARCNEIQVLKFGQLIDLEMVDKVSSGMSQEEARRRVEVIAEKHATELARLEGRNRELRGRLLESTYDNTKRLRDVADLSSRQFTLEKELNTGGGNAAFGSREPSLRKEAEERDRLVALVKLQGRELDAIKAEVNLLRRKGGHIYAPVAPPPRHQHQHQHHHHHHQQQDQQFYSAPAADNQVEDAYANQSQEVPQAIMEDARGDSGVGGEGRGRGQGEQHAEGLGEDGESSPIDQQQQQQQQQQPRPEQGGPESFGDSPSTGVKTN